MAKIRVLGRRSRLNPVLERLYGVQRVQLVDVREEPELDLQPPGDDSTLVQRQAELQGVAARLEATLELLGTGHVTAVTDHPDPVPGSVAVAPIRAQLDAVGPLLSALAERLDALEDERALLPRYTEPLEQLAPLVPELAGLGEDELRHLGLDTAALVLDTTDPALVTTLRRELEGMLAARFELVSTRVGEDATGCLLIFTHADSLRVHELLGREHVRHLPLPSAYEGLSMHGAIAAMRQRTAALPAEIEGTRADLEATVVPHAEEWTIALAGVRAELEQIAAAHGAGATERTFALVAWVPRPSLSGVQRELASPELAPLVVEELPFDRRDERVPVLMRNARPARPFASLTRFLDTPRASSIDPTALMALFLPLMFGVMVGDVIYGAILLGLALWMRRRFSDGSPAVTDLASVLVLGSVWAIVFGLLFGEALGNLGKEVVGDFAIWFYRGDADALQPLLLFAVAIGAAHVLLGTVLGVWQARRDRDRHGLMDRGGTLMFLSGLFALAGYLAGTLPDGSMTPAIAAMVVGLAVIIAAHGALGLMMGPLELLGAIGNVLSYLRLAAVGLASVYLAIVANELATLGPLWLGLIVATFFHTLNLALAAFSPLLQALRLHYVEFFSKFFVGGGRDFRAFGVRDGAANPTP